MNSEGTDFYRQHTRLFQFLKTDDVRSLSEVMENSFFLEVREIAKCAYSLPCSTKESLGLQRSVQSSTLFVVHGKPVAGQLCLARVLNI